MNPKKPSELYPQVSEKLNLSEDLIKDYITFYYKEIRRKVVSCESTNIVITGLGTLKVKPWKLPDTIKKYERVRDKYKTLVEKGIKISFQKFAIMKDIEERLDVLYSFQKLINDEQLKKDHIKKIRYDSKTKNNMEKQSPDLGGILEPNNIQQDD